MFNRNQLVHAVIWPNSDHPSVYLVDADGEVKSHVNVAEPLKGSELSKMMPDGYMLDVSGCSVMNMSGKFLATTVAPFDTAVVNERAEVSFEERMLRLERREARRERREAAMVLRERELMERLKAAEAVVEPVPDGEVSSDPQDPVVEPETAPDGGQADGA